MVVRVAIDGRGVINLSDHFCPIYVPDVPLMIITALSSVDTSRGAQLVDSLHRPVPMARRDALAQERGLDAIRQASAYLVIDGDEPSARHTLNLAQIGDAGDAQTVTMLRTACQDAPHADVSPCRAESRRTQVQKGRLSAMPLRAPPVFTIVDGTFDRVGFPVVRSTCP